MPTVSLIFVLISNFIAIFIKININFANPIENALHVSIFSVLNAQNYKKIFTI